MKKNHASVVKYCEQPANEARCSVSTGSASVDYRKIAQRKWGRNAEWISGKGPFAVLARCRTLTVTLWTSMEEAQLAKKLIDQCGCGGMCTGDHEIINLSLPNTKT